MSLPTSEQVRNTRFHIRLDGEISVWSIQAYEWSRLQGRNPLADVWISGGIHLRGASVGRQYSVTRIKAFPEGALYRTEWIGEDDDAPKSRSNVLHTPKIGMMLQFAGAELLMIQTACNTMIKVAVPDELSSRTRICLRCDRILQRGGR